MTAEPMKASEPDYKISFGPVRALTSKDEAIIEAGKTLLVESVSTGRDFCKHMIGISSGGIPVYLALLVLGLPKGYAPLPFEYLIWASPPILFLLAVLIFSWGYAPTSGEMNLADVRSIETNIRGLIARRRAWSLYGMIFLSLAIVSGGAVVILIK